MRSYNIEKNERITRAKAILTTLLIHAVLVYALLYFNGDDATQMLPDFVTKWIPSGDEVVASQP